MSGWPTVLLSKLAAPSGKKAGKHTNLPVYSVTKHRGFVPSLEYFKKQVFSRELGTYTIVEPGEFAYATIHLDEGSIGICPEKCLISPLYTALRVVSKAIDPSFLLRYLRSPRALAQYPRLGKGSVERRRAISFERLGQLPIPLPPLPEQRRIAEILDKADALRAKRRAALAQLDTLTQAIFEVSFGGTDALPDQTLESVCELITDGTHYTPTYVESGTIFLSSKNVTSGFIDWDDVKYIPEGLHLELQRRVAPRVNDVLLAKNGTTGVAALVDRDCVFDIYVSLALLRPSDVVHPIYLREAINSPMCKRQFDSSLKGIGVPNLHLKEIRRTRIPVPSIEHQKRFVSEVESVQRQRRVHNASLAELDCLFGSLQHRAFGGELVS